MAVSINNRYQVIKTLSGGMGVVYLCIDKEQENFPLAIKAIRPEFLNDIETRERFLHEANLWISFGYHPNIVQAYRVDYSFETHEIYILTELIQSQQNFPDPSLRSWIQAAHLTLNKSMQFALDVARGMLYVTGLVGDLVHRDLKPENVLVGADEVAKVCDFGIVSTIQKSIPIKAHSYSDVQPVTHSPIGTLIYMSPEQCLGLELDCKSDIYSFGLILYEMITGEFGIDGDTEEEILFNHINGQALVTAMANIREPNLLNVLKKCLDKEKNRRYSSWRELEEGLINCYRLIFNLNPPDGDFPIDVGQYHIYQMASSYLAIGASYNDIGVIDKAIDFTENACEIAQSLGVPRIEAAALSNLGIFAFNKGDFSVAISYYKAALRINQKLLDLRNEAINLGNIGGALQNLGKVDEAQENFLQSLVIAESEGIEGIEAGQLGNLGILLAEQGQFKKAISLYERAIELFEKNDAVIQACTNYANMANSYLSVGDFLKAEQYFQKALDISTRFAIKSQQAMILGNLANISIARREPENGIRFLQRAIEISGEIEDSATLSFSLGALGSLYAQQQKYEEAFKAYRQALEIAEEKKHWKVVGSINLALGNYYVQTGNLDASIPHFRRSIDIAATLKNIHLHATALGNLGKVFSALGQFETAVSCLLDAIQLAKEIDAEDIQAGAAWTLGIIYELSGNLSEALQLLQFAVPVFRKYGHPDYEQAAMHLIELRGYVR